MFRLLIMSVGDLFRSQSSLEAEIASLRQQIVTLKRRLGSRRIKLTVSERLFWVLLSRIWPDWRQALYIVKPETVIRWHRRGFRAYWRWKSRPVGGRPRVSQEARDLIRKLQSENPLGGHRGFMVSF